MSYYREVEGNLFDADTPAIGHGVNLAGVMGAGIAREFAERYPEMVPTYRQACLDGALQLGGFQRFDADDGRHIYNLASQARPGRDARYDALRNSVGAAIRDCLALGVSELALPRIGCGIGGLRWEWVEASLNKVARVFQCQITVYTPPPRGS